MGRSWLFRTSKGLQIKTFVNLAHFWSRKWGHPKQLVKSVYVKDRNQFTIHFIDKNILICREINQNLSRGQIIKVRHLKERFTVVEGQAIIIYADLNGINVKMDGNALQNGHLNEWIKVKNISSGKVVEGKIVNEKKILINY